MKKLIYISCVFILSGCAAGINHNVATVNGKNYLIESRNRNFCALTQWSEEPKITVLEEDLMIKKSVSAYFNSILEECQKPYNMRSVQPVEKIHKCVVEKFRELEKEIK